MGVIGSMGKGIGEAIGVLIVFAMVGMVGILAALVFSAFKLITWIF